MKASGVYEVIGRHNYRGHPRGSQFEATFDHAAEQRAIARGDIRLIKSTTPQLQPGSFRLPDNWITPKEVGQQ